MKHMNGNDQLPLELIYLDQLKRFTLENMDDKAAQLFE